MEIFLIFILITFLLVLVLFFSPNNKIKINCKKGFLQSPVDLVPNIIAKLPPIEFYYNEFPPNITNNIVFSKDTNISSHINIDNKQYFFKQFHFHAPSEHYIEGKRFPVELHIVHKCKNNTIAVISVMINEGKTNKNIDDIINLNNIDLVQLLPKEKLYYRLLGSLTTKPYSKNVNWYVMQSPITASKEQIQKLISIFKPTYRKLQEGNNRLIIKGIK